MNPSRPPLPALTTAQMAEVDRLMIEVYGIQLIQMMENAGRGLAELAVRQIGSRGASGQVAVLCGPGNNGGGGMAAARHLHNRGLAVSVVLAAGPARLKDIPRQQWAILGQMGLTGGPDPDLSDSGLIVDALLGYGVSGDPRAPIAGWIERANAAGRPIVSLDAPSGLDTTSGRPGRPTIRAEATLTLALPKTGLLTPEARSHVGRLYLADIGVPPELYRRLGLDVPPLFADDTILLLA